MFKSKFYEFDSTELHPLHGKMKQFQDKAINYGGFAGSASVRFDIETEDKRPVQFLFKHWLLMAGDMGISYTELLHLFDGYQYNRRDLEHSRGYITAKHQDDTIRTYRYTPERFERLKKECQYATARMPNGEWLF